jgi:hypothetical protein
MKLLDQACIKSMNKNEYYLMVAKALNFASFLSNLEEKQVISSLFNEMAGA